MNRKQYEIAQRAAQETLCNTARDEGREFHRLFPEQILIYVAREAALVYPDNKEAQLAYVQGYSAARAQRDAFERGE